MNLPAEFVLHPFDSPDASSTRQGRIERPDFLAPEPGHDVGKPLGAKPFHGSPATG